VRGVHQVVAGAAPRDAITNHVLSAREVIRAMGLRSEVFAEGQHTAAELRGRIHPHDEWTARTEPDDVAIIHYSIDSVAFTAIAGQAASVAIHYHNITPPDLLWAFSPALAAQCAEGRRRLTDLLPFISAAAADSQFNADELVALGLDEVQVVGILRGPGLTGRGERPSQRQGGRARILFVGRGVSNKAQDELILALGSLVQSGIDAELRLVGSWGGNRAYESRCRWLATRVGAADRVHFLGSVDDTALAEEYQRADVFACMSRHEGYCVPIIEALQADVPVVARAAGAIPETTGAAGLLLNDPSPSDMAEAINAVLNGALAAQMTDGRAEQLAIHGAEATTERLKTFVEGLL
jgi:glycosyltransferase involved in cell wall biosynthesis